MQRSLRRAGCQMPPLRTSVIHPLGARASALIAASSLGSVLCKAGGQSMTVWPSGLRRWLKAPVRKGVGSNPTAVTLSNLRTFCWEPFKSEVSVVFEIPGSGAGLQSSESCVTSMTRHSHRRKILGAGG